MPLNHCCHSLLPIFRYMNAIKRKQYLFLKKKRARASHPGDQHHIAEWTDRSARVCACAKSTHQSARHLLGCSREFGTVPASTLHLPRTLLSLSTYFWCKSSYKNSELSKVFQRERFASGAKIRLKRTLSLSIAEEPLNVCNKKSLPCDSRRCWHCFMLCAHTLTFADSVGFLHMLLAYWTVGALHDNNTNLGECTVPCAWWGWMVQSSGYM